MRGRVAGGTRRGGDRPTVLVVARDPAVAASLETGRGGGRLELLVVGDAERAFGVALRHRPDAVVLEIGPPHPSGLRLYRRLRTVDVLRHVPVVAITGSFRRDPEMDAMVRSLLEREDVPAPFAYLEKPVDGGQLRATLLRALEEAGRSIGAGAPIV